MPSPCVIGHEWQHGAVAPGEPFDPLLAGMAGTRLPWERIPPIVRASIEERLASPVRRADSQPWGFSPALASRLTPERGARVFVKAIAPDRVSGAPGGQELYRREARIAQGLPEGFPAPRLRWTWEVEDWVVLVFEDCLGEHPSLPWRSHELALVLDALSGLSDRLTPSPLDAPKAALPGGLNGWELLSIDPSLLDRLPRLDPWVRPRLNDLAVLVSTDDAYAGSTLIHTDIRADNVLLGPGGVVFVDWPHASIGAAWIDLLYFLPSVAMQGGPDPDAVFWTHPVSREAERESVAVVLAGLTGYFLHQATQPPPAGLPGLRSFQLAQGLRAVDWLGRLLA